MSERTLARERRVQTMKDIKECYKNIESANRKLKANIEETQRRIITAFKRDQRMSKHWNAVATTVNNLLQAGLKAIPIYGGYCSLSFKVLKDPVKGMYELFRTEPGIPWSRLGVATNTVMSPLGPSDIDFNYASGRVTAFNDNLAYKAAQFESDVFDMVETSGVYNKRRGSDMLLKKHEIQLDLNTKSHTYLEWRLFVLGYMNAFPADSWSWYCMAQCVASMRAVHEGLDDMEHGIFNVANDEDPILVSGASDMAKVLKAKKHSKISSSYSNLHVVLAHYKRPPNTYDGAGDWEDLYKKKTPILSNSTIYRVECVKAMVVAYQGEVRRSLAETVSNHLFKIINEHAGRVLHHGVCGMPDRTEMQQASLHCAKKQRESSRRTNKVFAGASPLRLVGAVLPSAIYNCKTTLESKKWARFLCAVSVFYSVLEAYFDKQFVCDELPSGHTLRLFLVAYADAFNTAVEYFCHESKTSSARNNEVKYLKSTLSNLLQVDPAIVGLLKCLVSWNIKIINNNVNVTYNPPGLAGFTHLNSCKRKDYDVIRKVSMDRYSADHREPYKNILQYVKKAQESLIKQGSAKQSKNRNNVSGALRSERATEKVQKSNYVPPVESEGDMWAICESALDDLIGDTSVPVSVQTYILALHRVVKGIKKCGDLGCKNKGKKKVPLLRLP